MLCAFDRLCFFVLITHTDTKLTFTDNGTFLYVYVQINYPNFTQIEANR